MKLNNISIILGVVLLCFPFHISYGQGARYTGSYTKSAVIQHVNKSNFVIEGLEITNGGTNLIILYSCENVIIRNNKFASSPTRLAIYLDNCKNITIVDNTFENVQSGLIAHNSQSIKFEYNDVTNIVGNLKGGGNGNMVLFDKVSGTGNSVSYNVCENFSGQSSTEDIINLYQSHGTSGSPIMVKGNWLRGGGPSSSGGGIILGDVGGSYQIAEDNIVVDPGQYGISIAGGHNNTLRNNKIYGSRKSYNNVGLYAVNWYEEQGQSHSITVANNIINYTNKDGNINNWWYGDNMGTINGKETNKYDASMNASILPNKIIGRAQSSSLPGNNSSGGGSTPLPEEKPTENATPEKKPDPAPENKPDSVPEKEPDPAPENKPDNTTQDKETNNLDNLFPDIKNDPSIKIYQDRFGRVCINIRGRVLTSAKFFVANEKGEVVFQYNLARFHTVIPMKPNPGKYVLVVRNGNKAHKKTITFR